MCESYARSLLRVAVAQMCQALGWDAVQLTACDLLSDVLERYLEQLARGCHRYSELYGRTDPGLSDISQAFGLMGVSVSELEDYVNNLEPVGFCQSIPQFPISKSSMLQFPAAGFDTDARNALRGERRDYIPEYFPPLVSLQEDEEEEEQVPPDMGTSAEAMQVSLGEEEDGEDEENDENWIGPRPADSPRPEGLLPAAKRPRLGTKPGASPEWSTEPREPLSSLNPQHVPRSPSPPLPLEPPRPAPAPPTPGHKPKIPSLSPARQKNKSPKRGASTASSGISARPLMITPPKGGQKVGKRSPGRPRSPRSPRPGPAHLAPGGRGWVPPHIEEAPQDSQFKGHDPGDEAIEDSIAAVIARACADGGGSDPFAYDSDSDSEGLPSPPKAPPKHPHGIAGPKHTPAHTKHTQALVSKLPPLPPPAPPLAAPSRWTMDDSIDEVIRKANQAQPAPCQSPQGHAYYYSLSDSPPTPPPLKPPPERRDATSAIAAAAMVKKKLKKDLKTKLKKKERERLKEKGKDKGKNKEKGKERKRDKERGQAADAKLTWPDLSALVGADERREGSGSKRDKDKHKEKKKEKEKSRKEKEKRDKGKERAKEERRLGLGPKEAPPVALPLFSPASCLRMSSMLPVMPILPEKPFHAKEAKAKDKDRKKEKKEKKKKKEREKERERERPREKEEKKKEKEREKKEKTKEKEKEKPKVEKPALMVEAPVVPQSPVIPRLTLRVGAGQDKIVISKVSSDLEPTPPPPRTPVARSGPGARMRSPPVVPPPVPTPVAPPPRAPPILPPIPPPPVLQNPPSQAKARGCSVVTETVSAYVIRDEWGNQIWICPGCNKPDDGSPMIGCDECDDWYHWPCVGIITAPPEDQSWYCVKCAGKKKDKKTKKRKRKAH